MTHWRTSRREDSNGGGGGSPPGSHGAVTHAEDYSILVSTYSSLPRSQLTQAVLDVLTLCVWMLLGLLGAAIVGGPIIALMWIFVFS